MCVYACAVRGQTSLAYTYPLVIFVTCFVHLYSFSQIIKMHPMMRLSTCTLLVIAFADESLGKNKARPTGLNGEPMMHTQTDRKLCASIHFQN